jgi:hypothetical protein
MYCFAEAIAATMSSPLARQAVMAAEKVHPVPCVFLVCNRGRENR